MTTETDLLPLPEPVAVKYPDSGLRDDEHALRLWVAHGYDTGGEPLFSAEQLREAVAPLQAEVEALRAESAEAAKVLRGALDARTDGEPLRVLANRASNALYWRTESAERAKARAERLAEALRHQRWCRTCAEDGWESCEEGRKNDALLRDQEDGRG